MLLAPPDHGSVCSELDILAGRYRGPSALAHHALDGRALRNVDHPARQRELRSRRCILAITSRDAWSFSALSQQWPSRAGRTVRDVALGVWIALSAFFLVGGAAVGTMLNTAIGLILVGLSLPRGTRSLGGSFWGAPPLFDDLKN